MAVVLPPINEVIDLHSTHLAMARRHLPIPIMTVLWDGGNRRRAAGLRQWSCGSPVFALDTVYGGIIRVSNLSVVETLAAMK